MKIELICKEITRRLNKKIYTKILLTAIIISLIYGCSTKKNTIVSRTYHNITSKYNAYFNGNEKLKSGVKKINNSFKDDYSLTLPMFTSGDENIAKSSYPDMDEVIKKASKVISLHSIKVKPNRKNRATTKKQKEFLKQNEYCKWIDNSWLMLGKAKFYKHDFYSSAETFQFVISEYNYDPIKYNAMLWLTRNYCEQKKFDKSRELLEQIDGEKNFPRKLKPEFNAVYADHFIKQGKYNDAIPKLNLAIEKTKKRKVKARYKFILAQIYQNLGEGNKAAKLYRDVVKMNPPYEMTFNAMINRAAAFDASSGSGKAMKKELAKMLHDDKNTEYLDQIYFALANIAFKEGNESDAIKNYRLSAQKSVSNDNQKALSYLALGNIYFGKPKYIEAQMFFDSAMTFLRKDYPNYREIEEKTRNLTALVEPLKTIQLQDSLQTLAKMNAADRNKIIDAIIEKIKEEEQRQQEELQMQQMNSMLFNQNTQNQTNNNASSSGGGWYFYNQGMIASGMSEFKRKWGTRKLEDNWRRKNKAIVAIEDVAENIEAGEDGKNADTKKIDNKSREYYLSEIPLTDSMMEASHALMVEAYYNAGTVYKERFLDYKESIRIFEDMNKKYPENSYIPTTYYYLYQLNTIEKNQTKADFYKNLILSKYPDSKYAKILLDPNFLKESEQDIVQMQSYYEEAYEAHEKGNYLKVIEFVEKAESMNLYKNDGVLVPKFKFLKAIAQGRTQGVALLAQGLQELIAKYPNSEIIGLAKDILTKLKDSGIADSLGTPIIFVEDTVKQDDTDLNIYKYDEKIVQYIVVVVPNKKVDVNRLEFDIVNFNTDFFSMNDFNVSDVLLNDNYQLVTIKSFDDVVQAKTYYDTILLQKDVFKKLEGIKHEIFLISKDNYGIFYNDKNVEKYIRFFNKFYFK